MRFIEAFLTKAGNVGMQFQGFKGRILSVYRDHEGKLVYSEDTSEQEQRMLRDHYIRRESWYKKKATGLSEAKAIINFAKVM